MRQEREQVKRRPFEGKWEDEDRYGTPEDRARTLAEFEAVRDEILALEQAEKERSKAQTTK